MYTISRRYREALPPDNVQILYKKANVVAVPLIKYVTVENPTFCIDFYQEIYYNDR